MLNISSYIAGNMGNLGQEQLMQLLSLMGNEGNGAGGASPSATNTPQSNTEMARQLRSLINDMGRNAPSVMSISYSLDI